MNTGLHSVQDVLDTYKHAVYEKDVEKFISAYATDIHLYDCWDDWECEGISKWRAMVEGWFTSLQEENVFLKTEFDDVVVEESHNLGFARCAVTFAAYDEAGQRLRQLTNRFTFVLRKENEHWKIIHEHSSLPIDKDSGKGVFHRTKGAEN